ncbi:AAA family ATPase [Corticimicrobacter populi]|uniref:Pilus assembly protein CpaE n=1 Tax=Corticimicrobacter populi TaxID=2175229 RepID=A0A2V1K0S7_9BURK|nr:pilus assembly protein CpaE [Corticimicrobacter populi]PWF22239.1 pilus assembly protein CpaE [Corticimicrobacter populi]
MPDNLQSAPYRFLLYADNDALQAHLNTVIGDLGVILSTRDVGARLAEKPGNMDALLLDFMPDPEQPDKLRQSAEQARKLALAQPDLPRIALGSQAHPDSVITALRAGVSEFADPSCADELRHILEQLLCPHLTARQAAKNSANSILLLGVRPGVGTSTLAVHMATSLQTRLAQKGQGNDPSRPETDMEHRVCLLDLGTPVGDCLLHLGLPDTFDFTEAVRNLRRLDDTLLDAALPRTASGLSVLSLPRDLERMRRISQEESLLLYASLQQYYGCVLIDAGGLVNPDFASALARSAAATWLVTDQSIGALVSLADRLDELEHLHVPRHTLRLLVNRYDERYGMEAAQIAEKFGLSVYATLPDRTLALMSGASQGKLLFETAERDPYLRSMDSLIDQTIDLPRSDAPRSSWFSTLLPGTRRTSPRP